MTCSGALRPMMLDHLERLASRHGAELHFRPATDETIARLRFGPPVVVELPPIRMRRDYFAGLHEFGHLCCPPTGIVLYDEANANLWALDNAIVSATVTVVKQIDGCLADYIYFRGHRPDDLPELARPAWDELQRRLHSLLNPGRENER